jgi:hypothetical protein
MYVGFVRDKGLAQFRSLFRIGLVIRVLEKGQGLAYKYKGLVTTFNQAIDQSFPNLLPNLTFDFCGGRRNGCQQDPVHHQLDAPALSACSPGIYGPCRILSTLYPRFRFASCSINQPTQA